MRGVAARLLLLGLIVAAGCYSPNVQNGQLACSVDKTCPQGYSCLNDGRCYRDGTSPDCNPPCGAATPVCDKSSLRCVGCLVDGDCGAGLVCRDKSCKPGCTAAHAACPGDAGSCDVDGGVCRGCNSDTECPEPASPRCDKDSGRCVPCVPANDNCPANEFCMGSNGSFACAMGCKTKDDCMSGGPPRDCCNHACVDTTSDLAHCGACGKACTNGTTCCAGACSDVATDLAHCGGCGMACQPAHAMAPVCASSLCDYGKCVSGFGDCDLKRENGCEIDIGSNPKHCGMCGAECGPFANAVPGCATGSCTIAACNTGFDDCDGAVKTGCEVDLNNDIKNCGKCSMVCPNVVNGQPGCRIGKCGVGSCNNPFRDCDGALVNGCEANLLTDAKNCGGCANACSLPNAVAACQAGGCVVGMCLGAFANCDGMPGNGCEVNTQTSALHCGGCNKPCPMGQACVNGACPIAQRILIVAAEGTAQYLMDVQMKLMATGAFAAVDTFPANTMTPTVAQLQAYQAILVFSNTNFMDPVGVGDAVATYYDNGGRVVIAAFANASVLIKGRFGTVANGYMLIDPTGQEQPTDMLGTINEPNSPLVAGVSMLSAMAAFRSTGGPVNGGIVVAAWKSGKPLIVRGVVKGRNRADINLFPPSSTARMDFWAGDGAIIMKNALLYQ